MRRLGERIVALLAVATCACARRSDNTRLIGTWVPVLSHSKLTGVAKERLEFKRQRMNLEFKANGWWSGMETKGTYTVSGDEVTLVATETLGTPLAQPTPLLTGALSDHGTRLIMHVVVDGHPSGANASSYMRQ